MTVMTSICGPKENLRTSTASVASGYGPEGFPASDGKKLAKRISNIGLNAILAGYPLAQGDYIKILTIQGDPRGDQKWLDF